MPTVQPVVTKTAPTALGPPPGSSPTGQGGSAKPATAFKGGAATKQALTLPTGLGKWLLIVGIGIGAVVIIRRLRR